MKDKQRMAELNQQNQKVLTLKQIVMKNQKVQDDKENETKDLRDHVKALQERLAGLGIEGAIKKKKTNTWLRP